MRKISANGPATAVATATTSPCRVPSKTPHAPTPDAANAASTAYRGASGNAGSTVVANTPLDAYCTANRAMHAPTTLGAGSHPNAGRPGHASTNVASASGDAAFGSFAFGSFAPILSLSVSPRVCPRPMMMPAVPKRRGTHHAVSNVPVSRANAAEKTSATASGTAARARTIHSATSGGGVASGPHRRDAIAARTSMMSGSW